MTLYLSFRHKKSGCYTGFIAGPNLSYFKDSSNCFVLIRESFSKSGA